jgi:hypothetical protein
MSIPEAVAMLVKRCIIKSDDKDAMLDILNGVYQRAWRAGREIGIKQAQQAKRHGEGREER